VTFAEVEAWVRRELPPPPARVLEIGAGDGSLARTLAASGYDLTAIDPKSESPDVEPVALADLGEPSQPFDAAVAVVSLHHVEPLEPSVERLARVLVPGAPLLLDEFDVDGLDDRAAAWWLARRRERGEPEAETPPELISTMRAKVHTLDRLAAALEPWFEVGAPLRGTYLYRWKLDESLRPLEEELVDAGTLPRTGVRIIARRRAELPPAGPPRRARHSRAAGRS
jgi:SAM-dependent methyltransferase